MQIWHAYRLVAFAGAVLLDDCVDLRPCDRARLAPDTVVLHTRLKFVGEIIWGPYHPRTAHCRPERNELSIGTFEKKRVWCRRCKAKVSKL